MAANQYEIEFNRLLAIENPVYYMGLLQILNDYQKGLLENGVVTAIKFESFAELFQKLKHKQPLAFEIGFDLDKSVYNLRNETAYEQSILKINTSISTLFNNKNSKTYQFDQKMMDLATNKVEISRLQIAEIFLETYDSIDFDLPTIKLNIYRFLDPKSDFRIYINLGKPLDLKS